MTPNSCIVVLTALTVEKDAVIDHLTDVELCGHEEFGKAYQRGVFSNQSRQTNVIVAQTGQTNISAAFETERVLQHFEPSHAFYVGVAGGLKDVKVGDVVIGSDVIGYERGKAEDGQFRPRPQFGASSYDLERAATMYASSDSWRAVSESLVDPSFSSQVSVLSGTIASGEKVDASYRSDLHMHIQQHASHALAIEMEGLGFLTVCRTRPLVKSLLLRGISDLVNDKGELDGQGSQPYASRNAAAFLFGLIAHIELTDVSEKVTMGEKLFEVACKLYPRGLEDRRIWERAGGDLSLTTLSIQGKGQWVEAVRLIEEGGGGPNISARKLIDVMLEDFPRNEDLKMIAV